MLLPPFPFLDRSAEAVGIRSRFDDVRPIRNPIQQRLAEPRIRNHLRPFREGQVRRENHRRLLRSFRDYLEQKLGSYIRHRNVTDLINGDQVVSRPSGEHSPQIQLVLGFDQVIHQRRRRRKSNATLLPARGNAQSA